VSAASNAVIVLYRLPANGAALSGGLIYETSFYEPANARGCLAKRSIEIASGEESASQAFLDRHNDLFWSRVFSRRVYNRPSK
jgi:hypothetical protein